jgi:hypothetical protein
MNLKTSRRNSARQGGLLVAVSPREDMSPSALQNKPAQLISDGDYFEHVNKADNHESTLFLTAVAIDSELAKEQTYQKSPKKSPTTASPLKKDNKMLLQAKRHNEFRLRQQALKGKDGGPTAVGDCAQSIEVISVFVQYASFDCNILFRICSVS